MIKNQKHISMKKSQIKIVTDKYGFPIFDENEWNKIKGEYTRHDIIKQLVDYVVDNHVEFPYSNLDYFYAQQKFYDLRKLNYKDFERNITPVNEFTYCKRDYKYNFKDSGFFVLNFSAEYNSISNYYHEKNRMLCPGRQFDAPMVVWGNKEKLTKNSTFRSFFNPKLTKQVDRNTWKSLFSVEMYIAAQFKPNVVKFLNEFTEAKNVLDFSSGWGDRLAGFYCSKNTEMYIGADPNDLVYETYKKQCYDYERFLGRTPIITEKEDYFECKGEKKVIIFNLPAEDVEWKYPVDFIFTSPPYFSTEKYNEGGKGEEKQSWKRYGEEDSWKHNFLFKVLKNTSLNLNGFMFINIIDTILKKRIMVCDDMVDYVKDELGMNFTGQVGLRLTTRPGINIERNKVYVENVWMFSNNKDKEKRLLERINELNIKDNEYKNSEEYF